MIKELTSEIEFLTRQSEACRKDSKRTVIYKRIKDLTGKAAAEFGRLRHWRLTGEPFTVGALAGLPAEVQVPRRFLDHPYYYRDWRGRPVAIAVHLYDWPEVGPEVEEICERVGLHYEAPVHPPSWWYPGRTQLVLYTMAARRRKCRRSSPLQLVLPFKDGLWVILEISGQRLEAAGVHVAVRDDGEMRIIYTDVGRCLAGRDGFTVYSARDMYTYVTLGLRERSILHSFKRTFGGTTEWRNVGRHH